MRLDDVVGQDRAVDLLRRSLAGNRLAHAYVFSGPPGVGKRTTALALARAEQAILVTTVLDWCRRRMRAAVAESSAAADPEARERLRGAVRQLERAYATSRDLDRYANAHLSWDCLLLDLRRSGTTGN